MSEKYVNYYIELMTNTMQDAVVRNVSLQTNLRISEEVIKQQNEKIEELDEIIRNLERETSNTQQNANDQVSRISNEKDRIISDLRQEVSNLGAMRTEYENAKHQVQHVDTFRNELTKERAEHQKTRDEYESKIKKLKDQIEYLQLTPAKRKKIDEEIGRAHV